MNQDDKTWGGIAHFGSILFGFLPALIIYFMYKEKSDFVKANAAQALIFQAGAFVIMFVLGVTVVGLVLVPVVWVANIILSIMGGIKAMNGELYEYPVTGKFARTSGLMR